MNPENLIRRMSRLFALILSGNWQWFYHRLQLKLNPSFRHATAANLFRSEQSKPSLHPITKVAAVPLSALKPVFFSHSLKREGAAISLCELILGLREKFLLSPAVVAFEEGPIRAEYEKQGIPVSVMPVRFDELTTQKRLDRVKGKIRDMITETGFDFIFANTLASFPAILAAHQSGVPCLWNIREGSAGEIFFRVLPEQPARKALSCSVLADRTVFVSNSSRNQWADYETPEKFQVITNALKRECFKKEVFRQDRQTIRNEFNLRSDSVVFLSVGSLEKRKGQEDLIKAFDALPQEQQNRAEVLMVGDQRGEYARKMRKLVSKCSRPERIHCFDSLEAIERSYAAADVFVLSSRSESYPRVILEAMAAGLPILTTPVDGVVEQVQEGVNAFFYKPFDSKALSDTMGGMIDNEVMMRKMGNASVKIYSSLPDFGSVVERYAAVIRCIYLNKARL